MWSVFKWIIFFLPVVLSVNLFGQSISESNFIFPFQAEHVHSSTIVELPDGDFLCAWFQGSGERKADDAKIMASKYSSALKKWQKPYLLASTPGIPDCNPVLFMDNEKLFLVWIAVQANRWEYSVLKIRSTTDFLEKEVIWEWQDNILLKPDDKFVAEVQNKFSDLPKLNHGWAEYAPRYDEMILSASKDLIKRSFGWMTRIKPLILSSGKILLPLYSDGLNFSLAAYSENGGETWSSSLPIVGRGNIQPSFLQKKNGDIIAYMRDSGDAPSKMQVSLSKDGGQTWTASVKTDMPSGASLDALKLEDDKWILVLNDTEENKRNKLSLYISENEGESWTFVQHLEKSGENVRFSYPALIKSRDGRIHLTYSYHIGDNQKTIRHVVINPNKIIL